jgi:hypothetical protein
MREKHMVENVEKALKEEKEHACAPMPMAGVKIIVNMGGPPVPHNTHMKPRPKKVPPKKRKNPAGPMEAALKEAY